MPTMTSRERMLRALDFQPVSPVPCCFMSFSALRVRHDEDRYAVVQAQLEMGLDAMLFIPAAPRRTRPEHPDLRGLPVRLPKDVRTEEWREGEILHKTYLTPRGSLSTAVRLSEDWPHGAHIPFVDDYQVPRCTQPLVSGPEDLKALRYLLLPPNDEDVAAFGREAKRARAFAGERGVLLAGGWGVGLDMAFWLCGMQELMVGMMERPAFVRQLMEAIHAWNVRRMEVVLSAPVDLYIRRAWYEGCAFLTPAFFREVLLPQIQAEADLAHRQGARYGYICTSGTGPLLDSYLEAGIDVLIGVDPIQGAHTDMPLMRRKLGGTICLWGGLSGAVTVERGSEQEVRAAVRHAIRTLGPDGLILSPVDNLTVDAPRTWRNVDALIDEWRAGQPSET
jgi:uroporphyrinogen-III decarboxylase